MALLLRTKRECLIFIGAPAAQRVENVILMVTVLACISARKYIKVLMVILRYSPSTDTALNFSSRSKLHHPTSNTITSKTHYVRVKLRVKLETNFES